VISQVKYFYHKINQGDHKMESITNPKNSEVVSQAKEEILDQWEKIVASLPEDYEKSALTCGALLRKRGIHKAEDLVRLILGYSVLDKSLVDLGSWAVQQNIADISAPALYGRLKDAKEWLGRILFQFLEQRRLQLPPGRQVRVNIRDATVISRPGSKGTDWRIHLSLDLGTLRIEGVELTDAKGGESLVRFDGAIDQIVLADRIHATRNGLISQLKLGSSVAIRMAWQNLPLKDAQQQNWAVVDWLRKAFREPQTMFAEADVTLQAPDQVYALRVCAVRLPKEAAELAVQRARKKAQKNGHTPDERTLFAAQFIFVVTNLSRELWSTQQVLELYRMRWQIEIFFKRLKSILFLDHLRARKPALAQTYLLGKLLAACLLDQITYQFVQRLPLGFSTTERPLNYWSLTVQLWEQFQFLIRGPLNLYSMYENAEKLQRFLCTPPRKRKQMLASAHAMLTSLSCPPPNGLS
jgi:hypothetical protein